MVQQGIPMSKIIIGMPMTSSDASTGYLTPSAINSILLQAQQNLGFPIKVGCWQLNTAAISSSWVNTVMNGLSSIFLRAKFIF